MQLLDWHIHLDKSLPGPLGVVGAWLHRAELALREEVPLQHAHEETANVLHRKLEQHKVMATDGSSCGSARRVCLPNAPHSCCCFAGDLEKSGAAQANFQSDPQGQIGEWGASSI